jgi:UDPglucose--hexose-1-phosphate uridylyltransferase
MSETRYDWLADRWVIFAPHRSQRPDEFKDALLLPSTHINCPFCAGFEDQTPATLLRLPRQSAGSKRNRPWQVRVVANKYPALTPLADLPHAIHAVASVDANQHEVNSINKFQREPDYQVHSRLGEPLPEFEMDYLSNPSDDRQSHDEPLFSRRSILGAHEVIIESPDHVHSLTQLSESHTQLVFEAFRRRLVHWRAHDSLHYAVVFKNVGSDAGASLTHSHSQLIATNFVPPDVTRSCRRLLLYRETYGVTYFADVLTKELAAGKRIVLESKHFVVLTPFASQIPYFVWILPKKKEARFEEVSDEDLKELALVTRRVLQAMETLFPQVAYNFVLHTSPFDPCWDNVFQWRMEIFPRLTKVAGFEWGSDCFINPVLPEVAASELSKHLAD